MSPVSKAALAYLATVEPWNYGNMVEVKAVAIHTEEYVAPTCPCCRRPIAKGVARVKVHRDTLHHACYMSDPE